MVKLPPVAVEPGQCILAASSSCQRRDELQKTSCGAYAVCLEYPLLGFISYRNRAVMVAAAVLGGFESSGGGKGKRVSKQLSVAQ